MIEKRMANLLSDVMNAKSINKMKIIVPKSLEDVIVPNFKSGKNILKSKLEVKLKNR